MKINANYFILKRLQTQLCLLKLIIINMITVAIKCPMS